MRSRAIAKAQAWPGFVDSVASSLLAGLTVHEALRGSILNAAKPLHNDFGAFGSDLERLSVQAALSSLATRMGFSACDEFCILLQVNAKLGGAGLVRLLQEHSARTRAANALEASLRTKVSATFTMARLAVVAPWVLLILLTSRPETAKSFDSNSGLMILLFGLAVCVLAYRLVGVLGRSSEPRRVYASG